MRPPRTFVLVAPSLAIALWQVPAPQTRPAASAQAAYADPASELPRIRFTDGQVSLNDRCPVRRRKLNLRMPPLFVNGRPVGFC